MPAERNSLGADRVRLNFNPSKNEDVEEIKKRTAELIDLCATGKDNADDGEENRLWSLAMTSFEEAAMWAVKAATAEVKK